MDTTEILNELKAYATPGLLVGIGALAKYIWGRTIKDFEEKFKQQDILIGEITKKEVEERVKAFETMKELMDRENKLSQETDRKHEENLKSLKDVIQEGIKNEHIFWHDVFSRIDNQLKEQDRKMDEMFSIINQTLNNINRDVEELKGDIKRIDERIDGRTEICNERHKN